MSGTHGFEYEDDVGPCILIYGLSEMLSDSVITMMSGVISLMMEAVRTSETLVSFYQKTQRNVAKDSHLRN
jgi:Na+/H+ antiporter NhaC